MATQSGNLQFLMEFQLRGMGVLLEKSGGIKKKYNLNQRWIGNSCSFFMIERFRLGDVPSEKQESKVDHHEICL